MAYDLFHSKWFLIYTAVSVCMVKEIRERTRKKAAYVYRLRVDACAASSGSRDLKVADLFREAPCGRKVGDVL